MYNGYEREILKQKEKTFIIISTTANLEFAVISGVLKLVKARLVFFFQLLETCEKLFGEDSTMIINMLFSFYNNCTFKEIQQYKALEVIFCSNIHTYIHMSVGR